MSRSNVQRANLKLAQEIHSLDDSIGYLLGRAYTEGHRNLHKALADLDLTPQQYVIVMKLNELGEASQNLLGRSVGMKRVTVHGIISRLSIGGLIEARSDDTDRRLALLSLSPAGKALVGELARRAQVAGAKSLASLTANEKATLRRILRKLF
jgi:MarR family transcriptional regulator, lower aerobic nicotinate degradation pathway regulator